MTHLQLHQTPNSVSSEPGAGQAANPSDSLFHTSDSSSHLPLGRKHHHIDAAIRDPSDFLRYVVSFLDALIPCVAMFETKPMSLRGMPISRIYLP
jgi:hypothetical protein